MVSSFEFGLLLTIGIAILTALGFNITGTGPAVASQLSFPLGGPAMRCSRLVASPGPHLPLSQPSTPPSEASHSIEMPLEPKGLISIQEDGGLG